MFFTACHSSDFRSRRGIALLVTVILLAFLILILVGTASLVRVETQVADNTQNLAQARQNALMGLNVAIGELQRAAGPDNRITARSDITEPVATNAKLTQPYLTGVWHQNGGLRNWLVSGNEAVATVGTATDAVPPIDPETSSNVSASVPPDPLVTYTVKGRDAALLVGAGSVGTTDGKMYVAAQKTSILGPRPDGSTGTVGSYAFWVGDDGIKADVSLSDSSRLTSVPSTPSSWGAAAASVNKYGRDQIRARTFERLGLPALFPNANPLNTDWLKVLERNQVNFVSNASGATAEVTPTQRKLRFHDFTVGTAAVMSDVTNNTLREDLSTNVVTAGAFGEFDLYADLRASTDFDKEGLDLPGPDEGWMHPRAQVNVGYGNMLGPVVSDLRFSLGVKVDSYVSPSKTPVSVPLGVTFTYQIQLALTNPYNAEFWIYNPESLKSEPVRYRLKVWGLPVIHATSNPGYQLSGTDGGATLINNVAFNLNTAEDIYSPGWAPDGDTAYQLSPLIFDTEETTIKPGEVLLFSLDSGSSISLKDIDDSKAGADGYYVDKWLVKGLSTNVITKSTGAKVMDGGPTTPSATRTFRLTRNFPANSNRTFSYELYVLQPKVAVPNVPNDYTEVKIGGTHTVPLSTLPPFSDSTSTWDNEAFLNMGHTLDHKGWDLEDIRSPVARSTAITMALEPNASTPNIAAGVNGYWGDNTNNPRKVILFDIPRSALTSVGEFRHALRVGSPSWTLGDSGDSRNKMFDQYFFSTVPSAATLAEIQSGVPFPNPRTMVYREPGVEIDGVFAAELKDRQKSAYRVMMRAPFNLNSTSIRAWMAVLSSAVGLDIPVYDPVTQDLNITAAGTDKHVVVWKRSIWSYLPGGNNAARERAPLLSLFPRFSQAPGYGYFDLDDIAGVPNPDTGAGAPNPMPHKRSMWTLGARELRPYFDDESDITSEMTRDQQLLIIEQVATSIVSQIRLRKTPFLSLEDFINSGIITRSINSTGAGAWNYPANLGNPAHPASSDGLNRYYDTSVNAWKDIDKASPAFLRQSDIIAALAPFATVRSDTFTIRAYGESLNPSDVGQIEGRVWLEAVVQRVPRPAAPPASPAAGYTNAEYLNPPTITVSGAPIEFGRKFEVISLRWLSKDDL